MASDVDVVNLALTRLGEDTIVSLVDPTKRARVANIMYASARDGLFGSYNWSFAMKRAQLAADVVAPLFQFQAAYSLPADCLRLVLANEEYVGADLTDYRGSPVQDFQIEGRKLLTNWGAPLNIRYVQQVLDTSLWIPNFVQALAAKLAWDMAEPITQSDSKRERAKESFSYEIQQAITANAIEKPPEKLADDEWIMVRL